MIGGKRRSWLQLYVDAMKDIKANPVPGTKQHPRRTSDANQGPKLKLGHYRT
jgi:hypothetical protein